MSNRYNESMSASKQLKVLSVRLPESKIRRVKSVAASRGVSIQQAVDEALEVWASDSPHNLSDPIKSLMESLRGSLAHVDLETERRKEREFELARERRWS
jgi:hypothetical protein